MYNFCSLLSCILFTFLTFNYGFSQNSRWVTKLDSAIVFSSPRFTDLNKDGILDVVVGAGNEKFYVQSGIVALNGKNGEVLWKVATPSQIYTSALFQDIDNDGIQDVFIGGRNATFYAVSGASGKILWQFWSKSVSDARKANVYNFFATQWIEDQNVDGFRDLIVANGGDAFAKPGNDKRPTGRIMIISGLDGSIIAEDNLPESRETYYAPHTHFNLGSDNETIIFATGGEDIDGKLWEVSLTELKQNDISKSRVLLSDSLKGFIVNSVLADLNNDLKLDIINARINGQITALDGVSHTILWKNYFPGYECYVAPTVGHFTGDATPDIFLTIAHGAYPNYDHFNQLIIDGTNGNIVHQTTSGFSQFASAIAVDLNKDKWDEIIYLHNEIDPTSYYVTTQLKVIDFQTKNEYCIGNFREGVCFSSTPSIVNLDKNESLEIIISYANPFTSKEEFSHIECIDLNLMDTNISFPGYLGTYENGVFDKTGISEEK